MKSCSLFLPETTVASLLVVFAFFFSGNLAAQDSTSIYRRPVQVERETVTIETGDTVAIKSYAERFNPRKALLYAAIVPGLGQIYNKKYWKLPLVYGGIAAIGWNINRFSDIYKQYKVELFNNLEQGLTDDSDRNPETNITTGQYRTVVDKARRERDFWTIMMGAMYLLQMVDAHVDAHLKEFDLNPNLQVKLEPMIEQDQLLGRQSGFSVVVKF